MNFDETLRLKALQLKQVTHGQGDLQDRLVEDLMKRDGGEFRNMCAHISPQLFEEIQGLCKTLDISQRRFVEGALIEAVKRANSIIAEVQPFELEG